MEGANETKAIRDIDQNPELAYRKTEDESSSRLRPVDQGVEWERLREIPNRSM